VVGAANKLFKTFVSKYNPISVLSYADRSWTSLTRKTVYEVLGFDFIKSTKPNYFYIFNKKRINRYRFRKDILVKDGFDKNKSEHQIMLDRGIYRIYDSGSLVYEWKHK
jgi:hypothetical protein